MKQTQSKLSFVTVLCGGVTHHTSVGEGLAQRRGQTSGLGWHYLAPTYIPRQTHEAFITPFVNEALVRLNPEIAAQPDRVEEVLYRLRAMVLSVRSDGLIKANEEFTAWMRGERSMPFGENHEHTTVRLIDFDDLSQNHLRRDDAIHVQSGDFGAGERTWCCW